MSIMISDKTSWTFCIHSYLDIDYQSLIHFPIPPSFSLTRGTKLDCFPTHGVCFLHRGFWQWKVHLFLLFEIFLLDCSSLTANINCPLCIYLCHFCQNLPDVSYITEKGRWTNSKTPDQLSPANAHLKC